MAKSRKNPRKGRGGPEGVVRRSSAERKKLPPELEAFARSEDTRLRSGRPQRPRLRDPRPTALIPGVANRDARLVHDHRTRQLEEALKGREEPGGAEQLARLLTDAIRMGLWRGRSVTSFEAYAQDVLGMGVEDARALATRGAAELGEAAERCTEEAVAAWFRAEAGLIEEGRPGSARVTSRGGEEVLHVELPVGTAPAGLQAIGRRMTPLVRDQEEVEKRAAQRAEERARRDADKRHRRKED